MWPAFKALTLGTKLAVVAAIVAVLLALGGSTYFIGYTKGAQIAQNELNRFTISRQRIQNAIDTLQRTVDVRIVTEYKDRVAYVDRVQYRTRTVIETAVPEQHQLSKGWIYAYNQSVAGADADSALASDASASGTSDRAALIAAAENNATALQNAIKLEKLQEWIRQTEAARAEATKE